MAMRPRLWTISGLAVELGRDRRTIAKALARVPPAGRVGGHDAWRMADALQALEPERRLPAAGREPFAPWADLGMNPFEYGFFLCRNLLLFALPLRVARAAAECGLGMDAAQRLSGVVTRAVREEAR